MRRHRPDTGSDLLRRRGLVAGWRGGQIGAVAAALVVGVGVLRMSASPVGVVLAVAALAVGVGVATWPIAGRTAEQWAPDALRHALARVSKSRKPGPARSWAYTSYGSMWSRPQAARPGKASQASESFMTAPAGRTRPCSEPRIQDSCSWARTTRCCGSVWSGVLASLARDGSAVHRVQWVERVIPAGESQVPVRPDAGLKGAGYDAAVLRTKCWSKPRCTRRSVMRFCWE